jgi:hypothetical protein
MGSSLELRVAPETRPPDHNHPDLICKENGTQTFLAMKFTTRILQYDK